MTYNRHVRILKGGTWGPKQSMGSLNEGDVFLLFEEDGRLAHPDALDAMRDAKYKNGNWDIKCSKHIGKIPEVK